MGENRCDDFISLFELTAVFEVFADNRCCRIDRMIAAPRLQRELVQTGNFLNNFFKFVINLQYTLYSIRILIGMDIRKTGICDQCLA